jgi:hypothetical protein
VVDLDHGRGAAVKRGRVGLYIMIDALGYNFLRHHSFLPEFEFRVGLRTVLGYSCACQPTLLSGLLPHEHGHGAMYQRRAGWSPLDVAQPLRWLPSTIADHHRVRQWIHRKVSAQVDGYFSLYECPTRLLPEFDLVEHQCIFEPGTLRRGRSIFDRLDELQLSYRNYHWKSPEEQNLLATERDLGRGDVDFVFVYLPALDGLLHAHGSAGDPVLAHLRWYEEWVRRLREVAEANSEVVELFVFSDHGMSDVHGGVNLIPEIEGVLGRNGRRYLAFYDSTMARFWSDDPSVRGRLQEILGSRTDGRLIPEEEKPELGVAFSDRSQGDLHYVMNEGLLILPSYMGRGLLAGMHGYHPDAADADACLLGIDSPSEDLTHIRDLYVLMEATAQRLAKEKA